MTHDQDEDLVTYVACVLWDAEHTPGSIKQRCAICTDPIAVSESVQNLIGNPEFGEIRCICIMCAGMKFGDRTAKALPGVAEEIEAQTGMAPGTLEPILESHSLRDIMNRARFRRRS